MTRISSFIVVTVVWFYTIDSLNGAKATHAGGRSLQSLSHSRRLRLGRETPLGSCVATLDTAKKRAANHHVKQKSCHYSPIQKVRPLRPNAILRGYCRDYYSMFFWCKGRRVGFFLLFKNQHLKKCGSSSAKKGCQAPLPLHALETKES